MVEDLSVVMATHNQIKVKRSIAGVGGPYTEITAAATRITLAAGKTLYEHVDASGLAAYWYRVTWHDSTGLAVDVDQDPFQGTAAAGMYCQVADLRTEGITVSMLSDAAAVRKIVASSRYIDRCCRQWFEPRSRTIRLDGRDSRVLPLGIPIIRIDSVARISGRGASFDDSEVVDVDDLVIYNRHLTEGLEEPDDRDTPRLEFPGDQRAYGVGGSTSWVPLTSGFGRSSQGVQIVGVFGYTELDPDDSVGETSDGSQIPLAYGRTPPLIERACMKLVLRDMPTLVDIDEREDYRSRWMLTGEKTADQSYTRAAPGSVGQSGYWTGDPEIDEVISMYVSAAGMVGSSS